MQPVLLSYEAPLRSNLQKTTGPVTFMQLTWPLDDELRMTVRLVAFNFFDREIKDINFAMRSPFKVPSQFL